MCESCDWTSLHVPVMQTVQFKHTGGYFCPAACPETSSLLLRQQINQDQGNAFSLARTCSAELQTAGGLDWGTKSPAASLNIDQKLLSKWMQQCQEGYISSEGERGETEKEMSLESLLIWKMFALSQKGDTGRAWLFCVFTAETDTS